MRSEKSKLEEICLPCSVVPKVVDAKVTDITLRVDHPNEGTKTASSFADTHVSDQFGGMNS